MNNLKSMRFDFQRLNPERIFPAIKRRLKEVSHTIAWNHSATGLANKEGILSYHNRHRGETLYLLANGPSINKTDLNKLQGKRVMCMNRFYIKFPDLNFTPNYLVCIEETVLDQFAEDFDKLTIPAFVNWRARKKIRKTLYLKEAFNLNVFFQTDMTKGANAGGTVTYVCLQLAYYMGFDKVVILGMDHSFKEKGISAKAEIRKYEKDESHFDPNYFPKGMKWILPDLAKSEYAYAVANEFYKKNGRQIIDATIGGKCEIFDKGVMEDHL